MSAVDGFIGYTLYMIEPANRQDMLQLQNMLRVLEAKVNALATTSHINIEHLKRIHADMNAALSAEADERVNSEAEYSNELKHDIAAVKDDIHALHQYLKHTLEEIDHSLQQIRQGFDQNNSNSPRRTFG